MDRQPMQARQDGAAFIFVQPFVYWNFDRQAPTFEAVASAAGIASIANKRLAQPWRDAARRYAVVA